MSDYLREQRAAEAIAREAGRRMLRERDAGFGVDLKARNDLVTDVDHSIEVFVQESLRAVFPDDAVLGEERGAIGELRGRQWLVDPIDGTLNFVRGIPFYCVSIALQVDGRSEVGAVYEPNRDELFSARRGRGAWLDGHQIAVSECDDRAACVLATGFPPLSTPEHDDNLQKFAAASRETRGIRRLGSAAIDLAYVACGRLDGYWEFHLSPWDTAAGYLLVEEAGGHVTDLELAEFTSFEPSILATNGHLHDSIHEMLRTA